jgi:hypothetical protein
MRSSLVETFKFIGYVIFMPVFMLVGLMYKPLKWIVIKCSDFDASYEKEN